MTARGFDVNMRADAESGRIANAGVSARAWPTLSIISAADYAAAVERNSERILGAIWHGDPKRAAVAVDSAPWPVLHSGLTCLDQGACVELWLAPGRVRTAREGRLHVAHDEALLWATISAPRAAPLAAATQELYSVLWDRLAETPHTHLLRIWNVISDINTDDAGLERYRRFCQGRHEALMPHLPQHAIPAASGVGSHAGDLTVWLLAAATPGIQIDNPRQVRAYHYPLEYGPRSPSFARATLWPHQNGWSLFISGTASIVGHQSLHIGDAQAQAREALRNVEAVLEETRRVSGQAFGLSAATCWFKVYVREASDYPLLRRIVEEQLGTTVPVLYLHADICRRELLFEIEGYVWQF
jgi:chorismate lyase/3-hydroxybenzoate synthase